MRKICEPCVHKEREQSRGGRDSEHSKPGASRREQGGSLDCRFNERSIERRCGFSSGDGERQGRTSSGCPTDAARASSTLVRLRLCSLALHCTLMLWLALSLARRWRFSRARWLLFAHLRLFRRCTMYRVRMAPVAMAARARRRVRRRGSERDVSTAMQQQRGGQRVQLSSFFSFFLNRIQPKANRVSSKTTQLQLL